jgi:hypothetical protein
VTPPYIAQPLDAFMAAQTSAGVVLGALVWFRRLRRKTATVLFALAIALASVAPVASEFLRGVGLIAPTTPTPVATWLKCAVLLGGGATLVTLDLWLVAVATSIGAGLYGSLGYIRESDLELSAATLAYLGLLVGVSWRRSPAPPALDEKEPAPPRLEAKPGLAGAIATARGWMLRHPERTDDLAAFAIGTFAAAVVCRVVLHGWTDSGDEWADTFQAALFAKLHATGGVPHCSEAFRTYWVFQYMGRSFAQYTPGWPLFMAPFVAIRLPWLASPAALGLLAAGVARLTRRAAAGVSPGAAPRAQREVRAAGRLAALLTVLSSGLLINGGSRYPHVFCAALFAWAIEALLCATTEGTPHRERWGAALGALAALLLATRPGDGACLGVGLFLYFVYALARRRVPWRVLGAIAATFAVVGGFTLVILRVQLGKWFVTGYSLTQVFYPWAKVAWSVPKPEEFKWGFTLGTGTYGWWPLSPAIGLAGMAALRGRARRMGFVFFFSCIPLLVFYTMAEFGRGWAMGYGPRYQLPLVVPMAVGGGVVLGQLWSRAKARVGQGIAEGTALAAAGPAAVALTAVLFGVWRIGALVYPFTYNDVQTHNRLHEAIAKARLKDAIVFGNGTLTDTDQLDLPENLPLELYPDQDVLIAVDHNADEMRCVRRAYPDRKAYRAVFGSPVRLVPEP